MPAMIRRAFDALRQRILGQEVTVYPSYGYADPYDPQAWIVPMRVWVHDNRDTPIVESAVERWAARHFAEDLGEPLSPDQKAQLEYVLAAFIADDKSDEHVAFRFSADPEQRVFQFAQPTTHNGVAEENFRFPSEFVHELRSQAAADAPWLGIEAFTTDGNGRGAGQIRFLERNGLSIISDIDDTIKVTHVPAGKKTVLRNTF